MNDSDEIRKRPGMYLGDLHDDTALHHCIWEVVDNSVDEHLGGHSDLIEVGINSDGTLTVRDYGRGIPTGIHKDFGISAAEVIMTRAADWKEIFNPRGIFTFGVSAVNAVSEYMEMTIHRGGTIYHQRYEAGIPVSPLKEIGKCDDSGTEITFKPDLGIFTNIIEFEFEQIDTRLKETAFLNTGLEIVITDYRSEDAYVSRHHYEGGLSEFVKQINSRREVVHEEVIEISAVDVRKNNSIAIDIAMQWTENYDEDILCFTNNGYNSLGGTHLNGLKRGVIKSIKKHAKIPPNNFLRWSDFTKGLVAIVSVKHPDPSYTSAKMDRLVNYELLTLVERIVFEGLEKFFQNNKLILESIIGKINLNKTNREKLRQERLIQLKHNM